MEQRRKGVLRGGWSRQLRVTAIGSEVGVAPRRAPCGVAVVCATLKEEHVKKKGETQQISSTPQTPQTCTPQRECQGAAKEVNSQAACTLPAKQADIQDRNAVGHGEWHRHETPKNAYTRASGREGGRRGGSEAAPRSAFSKAVFAHALPQTSPSSKRGKKEQTKWAVMHWKSRTRTPHHRRHRRRS